MRRVAVVVSALAAATLIAAPAGAASSNVNMQNFAFQPMTITVSVGDTVTWHNLDSATHTVTPNDGSPGSPDVGPAGSYPRTFSQPGTFEYYCKYHGSPGSGMHGTVIVQGGPAPTQPPPPAPSPGPAPAPAPTPAPRPTAAPTTTAPTTTTSSTTTTVAPPVAADAGTTSSTTAAAGGGVAFPAKKTSSGSDNVSPWLVALAVVLVLGAGTGGVLLRRRLV